LKWEKRLKEILGKQGQNQNISNLSCEILSVDPLILFLESLVFYEVMFFFNKREI
jgi:hypothetical protein